MKARSCVYLPQIDAEFEQFCQSCESYQQAAKAPPRYSWHSWPESKKPWQRIHLEYAGPSNGHSYFILIVSYTKWPDVLPMQNPTAQHTSNGLNKLFHYFGTTEMLVTDNGAQFTSTLFREICRINGIQHKFSPLYHPQSNGQAVRFVDTFKRTLLKAEATRVSRDAIQPFLRMYRNTPKLNTPEGKSPSKCLFGRKITTTFDSLIARNVRKRNGQPREEQDNSLRRFTIGDLVY
ncbi:unnamed protein product, partial [Dicrocoelium dendriticum]